MVNRFTPFGCRDTVHNRYQYDPHFRSLVDQLMYSLENASYTPSELREALILAATEIEFRTVRTQILDLNNYDIEDTVLDSVREKMKSQQESI